MTLCQRCLIALSDCCPGKSDDGCRGAIKELVPMRRTLLPLYFEKIRRTIRTLWQEGLWGEKPVIGRALLKRK